MEEYLPQTWRNFPDESTPITAEKLNYMENGIYENSSAANKLNNFVGYSKTSKGQRDTEYSVPNLMSGEVEKHTGVSLNDELKNSTQIISEAIVRLNSKIGLASTQIFTYDLTLESVIGPEIEIDTEKVYPEIEGYGDVSMPNPEFLSSKGQVLFLNVLASKLESGDVSSFYFRVEPGTTREKDVVLYDTNEEQLMTLYRGLYVFVVDEFLMLKMVYDHSRYPTQNELSEKTKATANFYAVKSTVERGVISPDFATTNLRHIEEDGSAIITYVPTVVYDSYNPVKIRIGDRDHVLMKYGYDPSSETPISDFYFYSLKSGNYVFVLDDGYWRLYSSYVTRDEMEIQALGSLKPKGTIQFSDLPTPSLSAIGDMYNISDDFMTTEDFEEGAGIPVHAGSNIYQTSNRKWDVLTGNPKAVSVKANQGLSDAEKINARHNIDVEVPNVFYAENATIDGNWIAQLNYLYPDPSRFTLKSDQEGVILIFNNENDELSFGGRQASFSFGGKTYWIAVAKENGTYREPSVIRNGLTIFCLYPPSGIADGNAYILFESGVDDIYTLKDDLQSHASEISYLQSDVSSTNNLVSDLQTDVSTNSSDITTIKGDLYTNGVSNFSYAKEFMGYRYKRGIKDTEYTYPNIETNVPVTNIGENLNEEIADSTSKITSAILDLNTHVRNTRLMLYRGDFNFGTQAFSSRIDNPNFSINLDDTVLAELKPADVTSENYAYDKVLGGDGSYWCEFFFKINFGGQDYRKNTQILSIHLDYATKNPQIYLGGSQKNEAFLTTMAMGASVDFGQIRYRIGVDTEDENVYFELIGAYDMDGNGIRFVEGTYLESVWITSNNPKIQNLYNA